MSPVYSLWKAAAISRGWMDAAGKVNCRWTKPRRTGPRHPQRTAAEERLCKGHRICEVARDYGLHDSTVHGWSVALGLSTARPDLRRYTPEQRAQALDLCRTHGKAHAVRTLGLPKATLQRWLLAEEVGQ